MPAITPKAIQALLGPESTEGKSKARLISKKPIPRRVKSNLLAYPAKTDLPIAATIKMIPTVNPKDLFETDDVCINP